MASASFWKPPTALFMRTGMKPVETSTPDTEVAHILMMDQTNQDVSSDVGPAIDDLSPHLSSSDIKYSSPPPEINSSSPSGSSTNSRTADTESLYGQYPKTELSAPKTYPVPGSRTPSTTVETPPPDDEVLHVLCSQLPSFDNPRSEACSSISDSSTKTDSCGDKLLLEDVAVQRITDKNNSGYSPHSSPAPMVCSSLEPLASCAEFTPQILGCGSPEQETNYRDLKSETNSIPESSKPESLPSSPPRLQIINDIVGERGPWDYERFISAISPLTHTIVSSPALMNTIDLDQVYGRLNSMELKMRKDYIAYVRQVDAKIKGDRNRAERQYTRQLSDLRGLLTRQRVDEMERWKTRQTLSFRSKSQRRMTEMKKWRTLFFLLSIFFVVFIAYFPPHQVVQSSIDSSNLSKNVTVSMGTPSKYDQWLTDLVGLLFSLSDHSDNTDVALSVENLLSAVPSVILELDETYSSVASKKLMSPVLNHGLGDYKFGLISELSDRLNALKFESPGRGVRPEFMTSWKIVQRWFI